MDKPPVVLVKRLGAPTDPNAVSNINPRAVVQDHLLMVIKVVVRAPQFLPLWIWV